MLSVGALTNGTSTKLPCIIPNASQQIRGKKKVKSRRIIPKIEPESMWHPKNLYATEKVKTQGKRPAFRQIIFIRDTNVGLRGESISLKASHAYRFLGSKPPCAVKDTPESRELFLTPIINDEFGGDKEKFEKDVEERRFKFNRRTVIQRTVLKFHRFIAGAGKEFYFPISKRDIANRLWNVSRIPIKEEDVEFPGNKTQITVPGYYMLSVKLEGEEQPAYLRLYLEGGGNTWEGLHPYFNNNSKYNR